MKHTKLTNEDLRKHFENDFELASFAIKIARECLKKEDGSNINGIMAEINKRVLEKNV